MWNCSAGKGTGKPRRGRLELREVGTAFHSQAIVHWADLALSIFALGEGRYETALTAAQSVADSDTMGWACLALPTRGGGGHALR